MTDILFHTYHAMKDPRLEAAWREMEEKDGSLLMTDTGFIRPVT